MKSQAYRMALLYDFYGDVLTERQKEFYDLYYNEDLSLSEIAENSGITRQGVRDVIVRAEAILTDLEDKTGLIKRFHAMHKQLQQIAEDAEKILERNGSYDDPDIEAAARETAWQEKPGENVHAELTNTRFPEKTYGDCTFPAGNYDALQITIGEAKGKNWWCVLFPSLCFVDTVHGVVPEESKELLKNVLTEEEYESLFTPGKSEYKVRWKAAEIWQSLFG